jgi:hypothetical protein
MLTQICQYLRNWFDRDRLLGRFKIENGELSFADGRSVPLVSGQYFRVIGSLFNDGVWQYGVTELTDEEFDGAVWSMAVPPPVLALADEISAWVQANQSALSSPYSSESFGGYSYTLRSGYDATRGNSGPVTWQTQFSAALAPWRKI